GQPLQDAEAIFTQCLLSWSDLMPLMMNHKGFDKCDLAFLQCRTHSSSPGDEVFEEQERRAGVDHGISVRRTFDCRTVWLDYPMLKALGEEPDDYRVYLDEANKTGIYIPVVMEFLPDAGVVLRARPNPYNNLGGNNFFDLYYRRMRG